MPKSMIQAYLKALEAKDASIFHNFVNSVRNLTGSTVDKFISVYPISF